MKFGEMLKELRTEKNITQMQLASRLKVTDSSIRDWEKERTQPSLEIICELAKIFNVTVGQLLGVEEY